MFDMADNDVYQDVIGQFPILMSYTPLAYLFPWNAEKLSQEAVVSDLKTAADKLILLFPWLGLRVTNVATEPGAFEAQMAPWPAGTEPESIVTANDLTDKMPSYDEFSTANCPLSLLDGQLICPYGGFPARHDEAKLGPAPVVAIRANFITGGILLVFMAHHNIIDAAGLFRLMIHMSVIMNGHELASEDVKQGNRDRRKVVRLLDHGTKPRRDHGYLLPPSPAAPPPPSSASTAQWAIFRVRKSALAQIKAQATPARVKGEPYTNITLDDAVSAFYWKRLSTVRVCNKGFPPSTRSKFSRAIDARVLVGVPESYLGHMVYSCFTYLSFGQVVHELSLAEIASRLRADLNEAYTEHAVRCYVTFLAREVKREDRSRLAYCGPFDRRTDVSSSSVAGFTELMELAFGRLGRPRCLRRPATVPALPGVLYVMPPDPGSEDPVLVVCLDEEDLEGLIMDEEWAEACEYIG